MSKRLDGKVALITGGAAGFGKGTAETFAREGAKVYISDINVEGGKKVAEDLGVTFLEHDVTNPDRWQEVIAEIKSQKNQLNILVNNAGIGYMGDVEGTTNEAWEMVHKIDLDSVFYGCKYALPLMRDSGNGSIINISSIMGKRASAAQAVYSATKHGVVGLTKSIAQDYASFNLRANAIGPGAVETPMVEDIKDDKMIIDLMNSRIPLKRFGQPEEIANLIYFLASNYSSYITGSYIPIDGGYLAS